MKRFSVILLWVVLLAAPFAAAAPRTEKLRVMSFNICPAEQSGKTNSWAKRKEACLEMLSDIHPDVAFLQDVSPVQVEAVRSALGEYEWKYSGRLLLLLDRKRFSVQAGGDCPLGQGQQLQWAKLVSRKTGREVFCFNVAFDKDNAPSRRTAAEEAVCTIKEIAGAGSYVLAGGSFFEEAGGACLAHLESWMRNARTGAKVSDETDTYNAFRKYGHITTDHIYYRNAKAQQYQVVSDSYGVPYISDHYPCFANLVLDQVDFPTEDLFDKASVAEVESDSTALWKALEWKELEGAAYASAQVKLFSYPQTVNVVKYALESYKTAVAVVPPGQNKTTSAMARKEQAAFAVNGGFFDPGREVPLTYIKVDGKEVSDNNTMAFRYAGLLMCRGSQVKIMPCNTLSYKEDASEWDYVLASGPLLLLDGEPVPHNDDPTYKAIAPRSCFGYDEKGNAFLLVVDGRFDGYATGLTFDQLAQLARYLGMSHAINLDGGGSSTLWTADSDVINHPYDNKVYDHNGQRQVNSIVFAR
ncbi:MAG: phosphodiester glycosidase family protein [Bacteroidales bacterium]|nr:phosphodiester glycosidase family protein [Bacteroidales bacterium]